MGSEIEKNKGGRPPKTLNDEQIAQVEAMAAFLTVEQIADFFGIGRTTFFNIMERQPEVSERYKRGKSKAIGSVANSLLMQAREGNITAAIFYLKTQAGWKETQGIEHSNPDGSLRPTVIELVVPDDDDTDSTAP
jgi:hypothetical protein